MANPKKEQLSEIQQKVLDFLTSLDHPATSNEVRDQFGFPLRANARIIFRKLAALGYGENRKVKNRYLFYVKDKEYPKPPEPEAKAEPEVKAESKKIKKKTKKQPKRPPKESEAEERVRMESENTSLNETEEPETSRCF